MHALYHRSRRVAKRLGLRRLLDVARRREQWNATWVAWGFERDLAVPFAAPNAKIPISIRPLNGDIARRMFDLAEPGISAEERELRKSRGELFASGIGRGFVALTETDEPCYCQWLIGPEWNDAVKEHFDHVFPVIQAGEALLEAAFTPEAHRGKGIMPAAMARIAAAGREFGAHRVITFVTEDNVPSIKGCERAGFQTYTRRTVAWRGPFRKLTFEPVDRPASETS